MQDFVHQPYQGALTRNCRVPKSSLFTLGKKWSTSTFSRIREKVDWDLADHRSLFWDSLLYLKCIVYLESPL